MPEPSVAEELSVRGLVHQNILIMPEILGAGVAAFATPGIIGSYLERRPPCRYRTGAGPHG